MYQGKGIGGFQIQWFNLYDLGIRQELQRQGP